MTTLRTFIRSVKTAWQTSCSLRRVLFVVPLVLLVEVAMLSVGGCERRPELYLRKKLPTRFTITNLALKLHTYWDYSFIYSYEYGYNWRNEWYYGWDENDAKYFHSVNMEYAEPQAFIIRRYYTASVPYAKHNHVESRPKDGSLKGYEYEDEFEFGFWDLLVWNEIEEIEQSQSLQLDETSSLDSIIASTGQSMRSARYSAPKYTHAFNQPEELFSAYMQAIDINENLDGFDWDEERNVWVKVLPMDLLPVTYIYLTQIILHNNMNRAKVGDECFLSGVARTANINSGRAGDDDVTLLFNTNFKKNLNKDGELVDIAGGRLLTFGIPGLNPRNFKSAEDLPELNRQLQSKVRNQLAFTLNFEGSGDTTIVRDVTDQVRHRFRGGVITVELDMNEIPNPSGKRSGSGFDAVVEDFIEVDTFPDFGL